ncbi:MAG: 23S rRNA (pseudouridine(1915)-N(3))-methyltransferase RlmH [Parafilimonas terrae]|nr:23S rRNA (pseudouridine(1915)-N(3))-methyltransferase RlmH [Parafilimonas terrae]
MRLVIVAVGRLKAGPERDLASRYRERSLQAGRSLGFSGCDLIELTESRARRSADRCAEEAAAILAQIPPGSATLIYDERGRSDLASEGLAERVGQWRDTGKPALAVVVGGPDGLDASIRTRADLILSFGAATLPHGLVRVLALEQMYRSLTILAGHPYHRGEPG